MPILYPDKMYQDKNPLATNLSSNDIQISGVIDRSWLRGLSNDLVGLKLDLVVATGLLTIRKFQSLITSLEKFKKYSKILFLLKKNRLIFFTTYNDEKFKASGWFLR